MLLAISFVAVHAGREPVARRLIWVMVVNFLVVRCIVFWALSDFLWVINDLLATALMLASGRENSARACAVLFFIILQFDLAMLTGFSDFGSVAAVSDLLGFIILVVIAGAAHDFPRNGRLDARIWPARPRNAVVSLAAWCSSRQRDGRLG